MHIVSDRGMDLSPMQLEGLDNIRLIPLLLTLDGKTYRSGIDIEPQEFYRLLQETESFPTTSQPSAGEFAELYRDLAATDPDILSIHISSGLSGTINAAREGAKLVPEANVTFYDSLTLSAALGWQVEAAAHAIKAGWTLPQIIEMLDRISAATDTLFTLNDLRYLIHGGRISHLKGLLASMLNIKPVISVSKEDGKYYQRAQARTFKRSVAALVDQVLRQYAPGTALRVQVMHAFNPEGAATVRKLLDEQFECTWLPTAPIAPVLGAHTGPSLIGIVYAPQSVFNGLS
jgi:DegV family protein with EDD domain